MVLIPDKIAILTSAFWGEQDYFHASVKLRWVLKALCMHFFSNYNHFLSTDKGPGYIFFSSSYWLDVKSSALSLTSCVILGIALLRKFYFLRNKQANICLKTLFVLFVSPLNWGNLTNWPWKALEILRTYNILEYLQNGIWHEFKTTWIHATSRWISKYNFDWKLDTTEYLLCNFI